MLQQSTTWIYQRQSKFCQVLWFQWPIFFKVSPSAPPWSLLPNSPLDIDHSTRWIVHSTALSRMTQFYQRWSWGTRFVISIAYLLGPGQRPGTESLIRLGLFLILVGVANRYSWGTDLSQVGNLEMLIGSRALYSDHVLLRTLFQFGIWSLIGLRCRSVPPHVDSDR